MADCCHITRRQLLRFAGLVAATPLLSAMVDIERAYGLTLGVAGNAILPINLELVTLTETSVVLTWFTGDPTRIDGAGRLAPMPADTSVLLGTSPTTMREAYHHASATPYHYAEITGLEPGQRYFVTARSNGVSALAAGSAFGSPLGTSALDASPTGPLTFTTPHPPPGRHLFSIALCNDLHLGETVAGLATTQQGHEIPPGIRQVDGHPPYPEVMATALSVETRERGADLLLAAGDLTSEAAIDDAAKAKSLLDGFGEYESDYFVTRGNHDRPHTSRDSCTAVPGADGYGDCFSDVFFPGTPTWFTHEVFGLRIIGLDTYDKIGSGGDNGIMSPAQLSFVGDELAADPHRPTLVFGHHPVSLESSLTTTEPVIFDLDQQQARQLEALYAGAPGVFLHHAGHTHRNKRTLSSGAPNVVFQEVAATKEYPGGFHLLRVFSGGYALDYYKLRAPSAQEWSERSRPEYGGLSPFYTFGNLTDRSSVVALDLSDLESARPRHRHQDHPEHPEHPSSARVRRF